MTAKGGLRINGMQSGAKLESLSQSQGQQKL
jgi:hypothetical protein